MQRYDLGQGLDFPSAHPPLRRAKSLDRRTTESVITVSVYSSFVSVKQSHQGHGFIATGSAVTTKDYNAYSDVNYKSNVIYDVASWDI